MLFSLFLVTFPTRLLYFVCIRYLVVLQWLRPWATLLLNLIVLDLIVLVYCLAQYLGWSLKHEGCNPNLWRVLISDAVSTSGWKINVFLNYLIHGHYNLYQYFIHRHNIIHYSRTLTFGLIYLVLSTEDSKG